MMRIYLIVEAAKFLGVTRMTLFNWIRAGRNIPGAVRSTDGRVVGFEFHALNAYKEEISK